MRFATVFKGLPTVRTPWLGRLRPNLTVGRRIAILSAFPLAGLVGVFVLFTLSEREVSGQIALSRTNIQTALTIKNLRDQITAAQIAVAAFLVDPSDATKAKAIATRDAASGAVAKLTEEAASGSSVRIPASIAKGLKTVSFDVDTIVKVQDAIGFNSTSGLAGAMTVSLDALQALLKDTVDYSDPLAAALSQDHSGLIRSQLRFALSRSTEDRQAYDAMSVAMKKDAAATFLPDKTKAAIDAAVDTAAKAFAGWSEAVQRVVMAQATAASHFRDLSMTADNVVTASSRAADMAQAKLVAIQERVAMTVATVIGTVVVLCCILCVFIGRGISVPIRRLAGIMRRMAGGDLDVQVPDRPGRDEIADMSSAVLAFQDGARQQRRLEAEAAAAQARAEVERGRREQEKAADAQRDRIVVDALGAGLGALSRGDLLTRIETAFAPQSETLRLDFNSTLQNLQDTIGAISTNSGAIQTRSESVAEAAVDLSRRTEQQAASLERTAATLDEITATVKSTADHASHARSVVATATASARASGAVVAQAIKAMNGIEASSKEIGQIIGVIDEIAFQTNLLALNAGVEAARAGDAGRGFAVVASEVRALAQRSAEAAKAIKTLISASKRQVDEGVDLVGEAGQALERIVAEVTDVNAAVSAIAASAAEQAQGLGEVNTAIAAIDQITKKNAVMVEETTATVDAMAAEAKRLAGLVARFRTSPRERSDRPAARTASAAPRRAPRSSNLAVATPVSDDWSAF